MDSVFWLVGPAKARIPDEYTNLLTAYHEAGHALVAYFTPDAVPLDRVTIIPRGQALGHVSIFLSLIFLFLQNRCDNHRMLLIFLNGIENFCWTDPCRFEISAAGLDSESNVPCVHKDSYQHFCVFRHPLSRRKSSIIKRDQN